MSEATNPLLDFRDLPRFDAVEPTHVAPAIRQLLDESRALIAQLADDPQATTWETMLQCKHVGACVPGSCDGIHRAAMSAGRLF